MLFISSGSELSSAVGIFLVAGGTPELLSSAGKIRSIDLARTVSVYIGEDAWRKYFSEGTRTSSLAFSVGDTLARKLMASCEMPFEFLTVLLKAMPEFISAAMAGRLSSVDASARAGGAEEFVMGPEYVTSAGAGPEMFGPAGRSWAVP